MIIIIKGFILSVRLRSVGMKILCVLLKNGGSQDIVHGPPNSTKCKFLGKLGFHSTIYTFKNYFATVFSVISFQFSIFNK